MYDCATQKMRFETEARLPLEAAFDGGRLTSDGGLLWLEKMDSELGLCQAISECVPEWRRRKGRHSLASLVRQRVFQIACGYEDQNDSDSLREDPLLKVHIKADRLSCHRLISNQFRLLLHAAAYWLMEALRRKLVSSGARRTQLDTLRLSLIKIGGRVRELVTKVRLHLASGHPGRSSWHALSGAFGGVHE
jgi:Transposase DDE domain group 1